MAHIEIPLPEDRHITIVHIGDTMGTLEAATFQAIFNSFKYLMEWEKFEVILDKRKMFGRNKNIPVMTIRSNFVMQLRAKCCDLLELLNIAYSQDWVYEPHITNPSPNWLYTAVLPIDPLVRICYKDDTGEKKYKEIELK